MQRLGLKVADPVRRSISTRENLWSKLFFAPSGLERRLVVCASLILIGFGCLAATPFLTRRIPVWVDHGTFFFPLRMIYAKYLASGDSIDWMPQLFGGFFTSGEGQQGVYHPLHLLIYSSLPVDVAYALELAIPIVLMPIGIVLFLRRFISTSGAIVGAMVFTYSQAYTHALDNPPTTMIFAHLPYILTAMCAAVESERRSKSCLSCVAVALLTASQLLLGYPQITWFCLFSEAVFALFLFSQYKPTLRGWGALGAAYLLAVSLAGVQLLATFDHLSSSTRANASLEVKCSYSTPPSAIVGALAPYLNWGRAPAWVCLYYGSIPLLLILWWVTAHRVKSVSLGTEIVSDATVLNDARKLPAANRLFVIALILFVLSTWLSFGCYGKLYYLQTYLPLIGSFRAPGRYSIVSNFAMAIMAAVVFARLVSFVKAGQSLPYRHLVLPWLAVAISIGIATYFAQIERPPGHFGHYGYQKHEISGPLLFAMMAVALTMASRGRQIGLYGLLFLGSLDLLLNNLMQPECRENWSRLKLSTLDTYLSQKSDPPTPGEGRIYDRWWKGYWVNKYAAEGRRVINGYAGLEPSTHLDYEHVNSLRVAEVSWVHSDVPVTGIGLAIMNEWYAVPNPLPRARLLTRTVVSNDPRRDINSIDVDNVALASHTLELSSSSPGNCRLVEDRPGRIDVEATTPDRQLLTISESHNPGWKVYIDERPAELEKINGDFLGCVVPAGNHQIRFEFDPKSLFWGKILSLGGLAICIGTVFLAFRWARAEQQVPLETDNATQTGNVFEWSSQLKTVLMAPLPGPTQRIIICIPIFNDWNCARLLLKNIDAVISSHALTASVLFVDDGSTDDVPASFPFQLKGIDVVEILKLRRNVGHQRAIALGLTYIHEHRSCAAVVVMDGDGEDSPENIVDLLDRFAEHRCTRAIFAQRSRRSEGLAFRFFYRCYKSIHRLLTGRKVEVGNLSVLPSSMLERLVGVSDLWNHYAASVFKHRLPVDKVPIPRAARLQGESKMNFVSLVTHGLSAISVFGEQVYTRILVANGILFALTLVGLAVMVGIRIATDLAIPGWATFTMGFLATVLLNSLLFSLLFVVSMLQARNNVTFLPLRDYRYYVGEVQRIVCGDEVDRVDEERNSLPLRKAG